MEYEDIELFIDNCDKFKQLQIDFKDKDDAFLKKLIN